MELEESAEDKRGNTLLRTHTKLRAAGLSPGPAITPVLHMYSACGDKGFVGLTQSSEPRRVASIDSRGMEMGITHPSPDSGVRGDFVLGRFVTFLRSELT